eukprot:m.309492 g.309492  ORF g.309492 m.309492 type:complete len:174 (+) comp46639_c0_seq1:180-701(+)
MDYLLACSHIATHSFWFGAQTWLLGFQGFLLRSTVTRQQFGFIQTRIFRQFFRAGTIASSVSLVTYVLTHRSFEGTSDKIQVACLAASFAATAANFLWINPIVSGYMTERLAIEKDAGIIDKVLKADLEPLKDNKKYQEVSRRFLRYHGLSVIALLVSVSCMFVHGCFVAVKI